MAQNNKIGILTSGGDSPGMNACVVSCARIAAYYGMTLVGIKRGYNGLLGQSEKPSDDMETFTKSELLDIADLPGTYLKTARCKAFYDPEVRKEAAKRIRESGFTAIIVIGGDGSFTGALELSELGVPCICIPGTIDNDLGYTEKTLGYDTAVNVSVNAVRAIRATSRSHERPHVVQVMGRRSGDIALKTAMATGAEMLVVPECEWDIDQISKRMMNLIERGNNRSTLIIGEHCWHMMKPYDWRKVLKDAGDKVHDDDELDAPTLARVLKRLTGAEVRSTVVGYTQRGATPSSSDSAFAFETAKTAINLIRCGNTNLAIGQKHGMVYSLPIKEALNIHHVFNIDTYELINQL